MKNGAVAQLGERLDGIQKVVGSIPSSSTISSPNLFFLIILFTFNLCDAFEPKNLLIPDESYKNDNQKRFEIENFKKSGISPREWRTKKCYRDVVFGIFWNSKLCPADPHTCIHSYAVEELHMFKKYYDYLLQIAELCADGYLINNNDRNFFSNSTQENVNRFLNNVRESRRKKIDYNNSKDSDSIFKDPAENFEKEKELEKTDVEKMKLDENNMDDLEEEEKKIFVEEKKINLRKQLLEDEKRILQKKKNLEELRRSIQDEESLIKKKKNDLKK